MSSPFVGEIRMFGGNFPPAGWAFCDGSLLSIAENETLFNLIGTTFGGDGQSTFALPDLRGRIPIHQGTGAGLSTHIMGEISGMETVTLTVQQIPAHGHVFSGSTASAAELSPAGAVVASPTNIDLYRPGATIDQALAPNAISVSGGSQPHDNMQPFLCVSFIISLFGIFPSQT
jgi:microcystin-dependent protein